MIHSVSKKDIFKLLFIVGLGIFTFWRIPFLDFQLHWDDQWVLMNNYTEKGISCNNVRNILLEFYHGQYAPVNQLYYTVLYLIDGYNPAIYHCCSCLIHCSNTYLIYVFIKAVFRQMKYRDPENLQAYLICIIFFVHPLNVESIAWISASKIPLYSLFYLLALNSYLKFLRKNKSIYYFLTILFFILSFGAKEQAVTLPIALLLIDYSLKNIHLANKALVRKFPLLLLSLFFGIVTLDSQVNYTPAVNTDNTYSVYQRIILVFYTFSEYFTKMYLPIKLSFLYPFPFQPYSKVPVWLWLYPPFIILGVSMLWNELKHKIFFFGLSFFCIHIVLTIHIINLSRYAVTADRYMYISIIGGAILFIHFLFALSEKISLPKKGLNVLIAGIVMLLSWQSHQRIAVWQNTNVLKSDFIKIINTRKQY